MVIIINGFGYSHVSSYFVFSGGDIRVAYRYTWHRRLSLL